MIGDVKERLVDIGLPIVLGVVSVFIVIALFSLRPPGPADDGNQGPASPAQQPPAVEGPGEPSAPTLPAIPEGPDAAAAAPGEAIPETTTDEVEPDLQALPEGEIGLTRIGFSFAGVVGACNVDLEAWTHVAVSRDLLEDYPCGSEVRVTLPEPVGGRDGGTFLVGDTMNPVHERALNIYVGEDEPAFEYGLLEGGTVAGADQGEE